MAEKGLCLRQETPISLGILTNCISARNTLAARSSNTERERAKGLIYGLLERDSTRRKMSLLQNPHETHRLGFWSVVAGSLASILLRSAFVKERLDLIFEGVLVYHACV